LLTSEVALANDLDQILIDLVKEALIEYLGIDSVLFFRLTFKSG